MKDQKKKSIMYNEKQDKTQYFVEIAITTNTIPDIHKHIEDVTGLKVETTKVRNGKFLPNGTKTLEKPKNVIIDSEEDTKTYAEKFQSTGRFVFDNENYAKAWRCLTFDVNYHKRPVGIYVVRNQELF